MKIESLFEDETLRWRLGTEGKDRAKEFFTGGGLLDMRDLFKRSEESLVTKNLTLIDPQCSFPEYIYTHSLKL